MTGNPSFHTGLSTVEVVNLMLGQGNDNLRVEGTLVPGPDSDVFGNPGNSIVAPRRTHRRPRRWRRRACRSTTRSFDITANTITRLDGIAWADYHFKVGQELILNGTADRPHRRAQRTHDHDRGPSSDPGAQRATVTSACSSR